MSSCNQNFVFFFTFILLWVRRKSIETEILISSQTAYLKKKTWVNKLWLIFKISSRMKDSFESYINQYLQNKVIPEQKPNLKNIFMIKILYRIGLFEINFPV